MMQEIERLTEDCTKLQQILDITSSLRSVLSSASYLLHPPPIPSIHFQVYAMQTICMQFHCDARIK